MPPILKLIERTKLALAEILSKSSIDFCEVDDVKRRMEVELNDLKVELVRSIVDEGALVKNKYVVVFLKIRSELIPIKPEQAFEIQQFGQMREIIDLQEGDIPIGIRHIRAYFCTGSSDSGTGVGGQQMVREVIVLRPIVAE